MGERVPMSNQSTRYVMFVLIALIFLVSVSPSRAQDVCEIISGAAIVAQDGQYLGRIASNYDSESVLNEHGQYGSKYSSNSIWNEYGTYGGQYSSNSPFNPYTSSPPIVIKNGKTIAYLTVNKIMSAALNPYVLKTCTFY